jgi:hypothetical protein
MISEPRPEFWACYHKLPPETKARARKAFEIFLQDPGHPSLQFKSLEGHAAVWSVRVSQKYRAVGVRYGEVIQWFWIGTHNEYEKLF